MTAVFNVRSDAIASVIVTKTCGGGTNAITLGKTCTLFATCVPLGNLHPKSILVNGKSC